MTTWRVPAPRRTSDAVEPDVELRYDAGRGDGRGGRREQQRPASSEDQAAGLTGPPGSGRCEHPGTRAVATGRTHDRACRCRRPAPAPASGCPERPPRGTSSANGLSARREPGHQLGERRALLRPDPAAHPAAVEPARPGVGSPPAAPPAGRTCPPGAPAADDVRQPVPVRELQPVRRALPRAVRRGPALADDALELLRRAWRRGASRRRRTTPAPATSQVEVEPGPQLPPGVRGSAVRSRPSRRSRSKTMYDRRHRLGEAGGGRRRSARASGPGGCGSPGSPRSLSAMISPSTSRSRSPSGLVASSGQAMVMAFSLRLVIRSTPSRTSVSARTPSHLTSWRPRVAVGGTSDASGGEHRTHGRHHARVTDDTYAVIGAGPSAWPRARNLQRAAASRGGLRAGLPASAGCGHRRPAQHGLRVRAPDLVEAHDASSPSSRCATSVADYPSHRDLLDYFRDFAIDVRPRRRLRVRHRGDLGAPSGPDGGCGRRSATDRRAATSAGTRA